MSGAGRRTIHKETGSGGWPNGLTVDYLEKRILWIDARSDQDTRVQPPQLCPGSQRLLCLCPLPVPSVSLSPPHPFWLWQLPKGFCVVLPFGFWAQSKSLCSMGSACVCDIFQPLLWVSCTAGAAVPGVTQWSSSFLALCRAEKEAA